MNRKRFYLAFAALCLLVAFTCIGAALLIQFHCNHPLYLTAGACHRSL